MITIKNRDLKSTIEALQKLGNEYKLKRKNGMRLAIIQKKLEDRIEVVDKQRNKLVNEYGKKDEEGNLIPVLDDEGNQVPNRIKVDNPEEFTEELNDLLDYENEFNFKKVPEDIFPEEVEFSILKKCLPLIKTDDENNKEDKEEVDDD